LFCPLRVALFVSVYSNNSLQFGRVKQNLENLRSWPEPLAGAAGRWPEPLA